MSAAAAPSIAAPLITPEQEIAAAVPPPPSARTRALLQAPVVPLLLRLAWPNLLVMLAQSASGLIETFWVGRLGTDALAGMALVFPGIMLMGMLSGGAMGGGISSAVARALGAGRAGDAEALAWHAVVINLGLGVVCSAAVILFGPSLYRALGGEGGSLAAALAYSNIAFAATPLLWASNALASIVRGTGNMLVPAAVTCVGVALLVPLSPLLIFGWGPVPAMGVAGGGLALATFYLFGLVLLGFYVLGGRCLLALRPSPLRRAHFREILRVGAVASLSSVQTNLTVALTTGLVGRFGPDAVAGYGVGARLEYLIVPLAFGLGAPLVAMVGTNIGAGQRQRALAVAWVGGAIAFGLNEAIGVGAAIWPRAWLGLFGHDPAMLATGAAYLRAVGPFYGFFGGGMALYFASQGAGRLFWPLLAGLARLLVAIGGGFLLLRWTGSLSGLFVCLSAGLLCYGGLVALSVAAGTWFSPTREALR